MFKIPSKLVYPEYGFDYETRADVDLKEVGMHNYVMHPSFQVLSAAWTGRVPYDVEVADFVFLPENSLKDLKNFLDSAKPGEIAAHNAPFERLVTARLFGHHKYSDLFVCSSAAARAHGYSASLEKVALQMGLPAKMSEGKRLLEKYSFGHRKAIPLDQIDADDPDYALLHEYNSVDAYLSWQIMVRILNGDNDKYTIKERLNELLTYKINLTGWKVDLDKALPLMEQQSEHNRIKAMSAWQQEMPAEKDLNFNSPKQLYDFCRRRGMRVNSLDEVHIARYRGALERKIERTTDPDRVAQLEEILRMFDTKEIVTGASLKKLPTIKAMTSEDHILRFQYLHAGAAQTLRTSGKGVQMQNLKRLGDVAVEFTEEAFDQHEYTNDVLASNMRRVFTAHSEDDVLLVADFSSVEARMLAYLAKDADVIENYRQGLDAYKAQAAEMYGIKYEDVSYEQRRAGKVGVLACGYQGGGPAVKSFAEKMGIHFTEEEAAELVSKWRAANTCITEFWKALDVALHNTVQGIDWEVSAGLHSTVMIKFQRFTAPASLLAIHPGCSSLRIIIKTDTGSIKSSRVYHGVHEKGGSIAYYKPSSVGKDLWNPTYTDPKTGKQKDHTIYGGKLAGHITQSICRELFFIQMQELEDQFAQDDSVNIVGQFHDEVVVNCPKENIDLISDDVHAVFTGRPTGLHGFPLEASVAYDYRYIK